MPLEPCSARRKWFKIFMSENRTIEEEEWGGEREKKWEQRAFTWTVYFYWIIGCAAKRKKSITKKRD